MNRIKKISSGGFFAILAGSLFLVGCLSRPDAPTAALTLPASETVLPTRQASSSPTPSPTASSTPVPSLTLLPTSSPTPEPPAAANQPATTPSPQPKIAFEPASAADAAQLAIWGRGAIRQRQLAAEGRVWVVLSSLGIYLYDTQTLDRIAFLEDVQADQISPDGQRLAVANSNQQVSIYRLIDGQKLLSLDSPSFGERASAPDGAAPIEGATISENADDLPVETGPPLPEAVTELQGPEQLPGITALRFSADGSKLAIGYNQPAILVWDLETGQIVSSLAHAIMPAANRIEFSPDGRYLANNTNRNVLGLWSLTDERLIWRTANGGRLTSASFLPNGKQLLTESATSERVFVWDLNSGSLEQTIQITNLVDYLSFSQDGGSLYFLTRRPQSGTPFN